MPVMNRIHQCSLCEAAYWCVSPKGSASSQGTLAGACLKEPFLSGSPASTVGAVCHALPTADCIAYPRDWMQPALFLFAEKWQESVSQMSMLNGGEACIKVNKRNTRQTQWKCFIWQTCQNCQYAGMQILDLLRDAAGVLCFPNLFDQYFTPWNIFWC